MTGRLRHSIQRVAALGRRNLALLREFAIRHLRDIADEAWGEGRLPRAETAYKLILCLTHDDPDALASLRDIYLEADLVELAIALEQSRLRNEPEDFDRHLDLTHMHLRRGNMSEARRELESAAQLGPDSYFVDYMRGHLHRHANKLDQALADFRTALEKDPDHLPAIQELSVTLSDCNLRNEAVWLLEDALRRNPGFIEGYALLAFLIINRNMIRSS